jgi:flagellar basal-body rod protein FlgB
MAISDLPIFSMLSNRMDWHQECQRLLAENVANADTPCDRARELAPLDFRCQVEQASGQLQLALTAPAHLTGGRCRRQLRGRTSRKIRREANG